MYLMLLLLLTVVLLTIGDLTVVSIITVAFTLAIIVSTRASLRQRFIPYTMFTAAAGIMLFNDISLFDAIGRARPFMMTILMIISITLIGALINPAGIVYLYARLKNQFKGRNEHNMLIYSSVVASPLLNMATPVIYGEMFRNGASTHDVIVANNVKYGMMIAMLVAPTFAPIALVIGAHPGIHWTNTIAYSLPIAFITLMYFVFTSKGVFQLNMDRKGDSANSGVIWMLVYLGLMFTLLMNNLFNVVVSIIVAAQLTVVLAIVSQRRGRVGEYFRRINIQCGEVIKKINNEALIFVASGVLLVSITQFMKNDLASLSFIVKLDSQLLVPFVLLVLPLLSMARLHPVIGFTLLQPFVYLNNDLMEIQKYMLWVCYWAISLQISPISVINIATSNAFDIRAASLTTLNDFVKVYILGMVYTLFIIFYGGLNL